MALKNARGLFPGGMAARRRHSVGLRSGLFLPQAANPQQQAQEHRLDRARTQAEVRTLPRARPRRARGRVLTSAWVRARSGRCSWACCCGFAACGRKGPDLKPTEWRRRAAIPPGNNPREFFNAMIQTLGAPSLSPKTKYSERTKLPLPVRNERGE